MMGRISRRSARFEWPRISGSQVVLQEVSLATEQEREKEIVPVHGPQEKLACLLQAADVCLLHQSSHVRQQPVLVLGRRLERQRARNLVLEIVRISQQKYRDADMR
jgi:hypothetical protein